MSANSLSSRVAIVMLVGVMMGAQRVDAQSRAYVQSVHVENSQQVRVVVDRGTYTIYKGPRAREVAAALEPVLLQQIEYLRMIREEHRDGLDRAAEQQEIVEALLLGMQSTLASELRSVIVEQLAEVSSPGAALWTLGAGVFAPLVGGQRTVGPMVSTSAFFSPWSARGLTNVVNVLAGASVAWSYGYGESQPTLAPDRSSIARRERTRSHVLVRPGVELLFRGLRRFDLWVRPTWSVHVRCQRHACSASYRGAALDLGTYRNFSPSHIRGAGLGLELGYQRLEQAEIAFSGLQPAEVHRRLPALTMSGRLLFAFDFNRR